MTGFKLSLNFWTVVTLAFTLGSLVYLFDAKPDIAPLFMAAAIPFAVGVIGQMQQSAKNTEDIAKLDSKVVGVAASVDTNTAITQQAEAKAEKAVDGVKAVHGIVDGQRTAMEQQIESLNRIVEELRMTLVHERAVTPPAPSGSTPAHGTPIGGAPVEGATVITIDPPEAATITSVPPKGKRPSPGDQH